MLNLTGKISFAVAVLLLSLSFASPTIGQPAKKLVAGGCVTEYYLMQDLVNGFVSSESAINK